MVEKKQPVKRAKKTEQASSNVNVYGTDGSVKGHVGLPVVFSTPYRPDLIRRAVLTARANRRQRYGPSKVAGLRHSVSTWGKGRGVSRVQRMVGSKTAAESPNNVGGRRAHPPRVEHYFTQKMNKKERSMAKASALAATSDHSKVMGRGHKLKEGITLPVVVEDDIEAYSRTGDIVTLLRSLGLEADIQRAKEGTHIRAGRGKMRGRKYRTPRSVLFVASPGSPILIGARNIPGVSTATPKGLNTEALAPGGDPGRLMVLSKKALATLGGE
ncbi:MAG: 50S ribosomal protein L4 [Candidatus Thermoplasmatota archaeon]|jgi:large subunit ribosomal protein L4e|nr:50S ribosomal protein L4 [Candidatus Thermoplasmatota archaeon]